MLGIKNPFVNKIYNQNISKTSIFFYSYLSENIVIALLIIKKEKIKYQPSTIFIRLNQELISKENEVYCLIGNLHNKRKDQTDDLIQELVEEDLLQDQI